MSDQTSPFIPGRELSRRFHVDVVAPILARRCPGLPYTAALIGAGSEVMGFDTEMSTDHNWGPRLQILLAATDLDQRSMVDGALHQELPPSFMGFPVFVPTPDGMSTRHLVQVDATTAFMRSTLGFPIDEPISAGQWLSVSSQRLLSVASATIYRDDLDLQAQIGRIEWYPRDVWLYLLASAWTRVGQEEHLVGRAGYVGDELGARVIASRLVRDMMRIGFLLERKYAPYPKWFGTAFRRLDAGERLLPLLEAVLNATDWQDRDRRLVSAYEAVADLQNLSGLVESAPAEAVWFHDRPFHVIEFGAGFATRLLGAIADREVKRIAQARPIGNLDLFSDSTDLAEDLDRQKALLDLFSVDD
ncbi:MAG: DUF4037 domain-containing protein [Fimbriimonas sp.]|nr:DUF4037 domain-containing protein [Fimbriimonas sp.]